MPRNYSTNTNTKPVAINIAVTLANGRTERVTIANAIRVTFGYGDADGSWTVYPARSSANGQPLTDPTDGLVDRGEGRQGSSDGQGRNGGEGWGP